MEDLFYQLITKLSELSEIDFNNLLVDGTKIEANANKYTYVWKKNVQRNEMNLDNKINDWIVNFNKNFNTHFSNLTQIEKYITLIT